MHAAKVILLLLTTLAVMRITSWFFGWLLQRLARARRLWGAVMSNAIALCGFAGLLFTQRVPGELIDLSALTFGVLVFSLYAVVDLRWTPWGRKKAVDDARC